MRIKTTKTAAEKWAPVLAKAKCRCRKPKRHRDCLYCGCGGPGTHVCGVCKENGIDGPVIRGTSRVRCAKHGGAKKKTPRVQRAQPNPRGKIETRGRVTVQVIDGEVSINNGCGLIVRGSLMRALKFGYHPVVRLHLDGEMVREFEMDTKPTVVEAAFDAIFQHEGSAQ